MYQQFRDYMIKDLGMSADEVDANMLLGEQLDTVNITTGTVNISANKIEEEKKYIDANGNIVTESSAIKDGLVTKTEDGKYISKGYEETPALDFERAISMLGYTPADTTTKSTQGTETGDSADEQGSKETQTSGDNKDNDKEFTATAIPDLSLVDSEIASRNPTDIQVIAQFTDTSIDDGIASYDGATVQTVAVANISPIRTAIDQLQGTNIKVNLVSGGLTGSIG